MNDPIRCPTCSETTWTKTRHGTFHEEILADSLTYTGYEDEDDHFDGNTTYTCAAGHEITNDDLATQVELLFEDSEISTL